ncbi:MULTISPECIES: hypothetical protein [unclassified Novosphingobium]|uniref:hypothetical protein n=1 Tax=unclassified Novosphingobium TaxID=2644732 RepID=UPI001357179C|nr:MULTISPECIES: hypothetical protein [unclassified Novosphingobium]
MITALFLLATGTTVLAPAPDGDKSQDRRKCEYVIERAVEKSGRQPQAISPSRPMLLSAVEKRVQGCPVLVEAGTGRMIEPPAFNDGPARKSPAQ